MDEKRYSLPKELLDKGLETMHYFFGPEVVDTMRKASVPSEGEDDFIDQKRGWIFGYIFNRPGLDLKTRAIVALAMLTAQQDTASVRIMRAWIMALARLGSTETEIREILIMSEIYCGAQKCRNALDICTEVFQQRAAAQSKL